MKKIILLAFLLVGYTLSFSQHVIKAHKGAVRDIDLAGKFFVTVGDDGFVRVWSLRGKKILEIKSHNGQLLSVAINRRGFIATAGDDYLVRIWRLPSGKLTKVLKGHTEYVRALAFSKFGRKLASGDDLWEVKVWDATSWSPLGTFKGHRGWVYSVAFSPRGDFLISASKDRTMRVWFLTKGEP